MGEKKREKKKEIRNEQIDTAHVISSLSPKRVDLNLFKEHFPFG